MGQRYTVLRTHTAKTKYRNFETNIPRKGNLGVSVTISTLMRLWVIYIFPWSVCLFCWRKYVDRSWDFINRSQTHECGNWGWGRAIYSIPRKEINNGIFVAVHPFADENVAENTVVLGLTFRKLISLTYYLRLLKNLARSLGTRRYHIQLPKIYTKVTLPHRDKKKSWQTCVCTRRQIYTDKISYGASFKEKLTNAMICL